MLIFLIVPNLLVPIEIGAQQVPASVFGAKFLIEKVHDRALVDVWNQLFYLFDSQIVQFLLL